MNTIILLHTCVYFLMSNKILTQNEGMLDTMENVKLMFLQTIIVFQLSAEVCSLSTLSNAQLAIKYPPVQCLTESNALPEWCHSLAVKCLETFLIGLYSFLNVICTSRALFPLVYFGCINNLSCSQDLLYCIELACDHIMTTVQSTM